MRGRVGDYKRGWETIRGGWETIRGRVGDYQRGTKLAVGHLQY